MKQYKRGETPKLYANVKLEVIDDDGNLSDGALVNPFGSIKIIIADPKRAIVQVLTTMNHDATGKYSYSGYTIAADAMTGIYKYDVVADDGSGKVITSGCFEVLEEVA